MKVLIYARVSKREGQDVDVQLYHLREYCRLHDYEIVAEYTDKAESTNLRGRVQWRQLLEHVRRGGVDAVIVMKLDRAFRSAKDTYDHLELFERHNVGFIATTQAFDTVSSTGRLVLGVLAAVAEFEKALISERTRDGLAKAKAPGKVLGRPKGRKDSKPRRRNGYFARWAT